RRPWAETSFCAEVGAPGVRVNAAWFRGEWFDPLTLAWRDVEIGACYERKAPTEGNPAPGASLFGPFQAHQSRALVVRGREQSRGGGGSRARVRRGAADVSAVVRRAFQDDRGGRR